MLVRNDGQTFGEQEVIGKAWLDFDNVTRLTEMLDILDQHQLDPAIRTFGEARKSGGSFFRRCHDSNEFQPKTWDLSGML